MKKLVLSTYLIASITLSPLAFAQATHPSEATPGKPSGAADPSGPGSGSSTNNAPEKQNPASGTDAAPKSSNK